MTDETPNKNGFDTLSQEGRVDFRLRRAGQYTDDEGRALMEELGAWRRSHLTPQGKAISWKAIADRLGIPPSTFSELRRGAYRGDRQRLYRVIDTFLAEERAKAGRFDVQAYARTGVARRIWGVIACCIKQSLMAAVVAEAGVGKTAAARAFAADREGTVCIRVDEVSGDARGVTAALWRAFRRGGTPSHRARLAGLIKHLRTVRTAVILIDEAQKLKADGLEALRDLHDASDPDGRRNVPIVFFGDHGFLRLIVRARSGEPGAIRAQLSRRLYPVLELASGAGQGGGEPLFSVEDLTKVLRNDRLRVVTEAGVRWLCSLANTPGYGALGFAMAIARMAFDIARETPVGVEDLRRALAMAIGPRAVEDLDHTAGGELLRRVG